MEDFKICQSKIPRFSQRFGDFVGRFEVSIKEI